MIVTELLVLVQHLLMVSLDPHVTTGVSTDTPGFGSTTVTQVVVSVNSLNGLTGLAASSFYGEYMG